MDIAEYYEQKRLLIRISKKMCAACCSKAPSIRDGKTLAALEEFAVMYLLQLCQDKRFLDDFEQLLEISEGTPKNRKEEE